MQQKLRFSVFTVCLSLAWIFASTSTAEELFRVGIIGCDTSHVPSFTKRLQEATAGDAKPMRVVAAFPGGSDDIAISRDRVKGYTEGLRQNGVTIVDSIDALLPLVDGVLLESVDGRKHLEQVKPVFAAKKPVFIDKPVAASLKDAIEIFRLAEQSGTPCFTSSSLRYAPELVALKQKMLGDSSAKLVGCDAFGPCALEPTHVDLTWYGIHTVEMLYTVMGPGCETVSRTHTADADVVVGVWKDGRIGTVRGNRKAPAKYGITIFADKAIETVMATPGENGLMTDIATLFRTHKAAVPAAETLEMFTFMEAADESKRQGGAVVKLADVLKAASAK